MAKIAWSGVLRALLHTKPNDAIDWIVETSNKDRGNFKKYLDKIFIEADLDHVKKLLTIKDDNVRLMTLNSIYDQLSNEELQELAKDENLNISSVAFIELIKREQNISESQIDSHFDEKKQKDKSTFHSRIGNALANPFYSQLPDFDHYDVLYEYYKRQEKESLLREISWDSIKSPIRYAALINEHYEQFEELLVNDIKSGFDRIKVNAIENYRKKYGEMANGLIETFNKYDDMIKGSFYRDAFRVLLQNAQEKDLEIIREYLRNPHFSYYKDDILYYILEIIEKFGNENETDLILNILERSDYGVKNKAANLLLKISSEEREKYAQYLFHEDEISLYKLLLNFSLNEEEVLTVDSVKELTYKPNSILRLAALAYLFKKLSEDHLKEFLDQYPLADGFDFYYYDIICWLDRIVYAPYPIKEYYHNSLEQFLE